MLDLDDKNLKLPKYSLKWQEKIYEFDLLELMYKWDQRTNTDRKNPIAEAADLNKLLTLDVPLSTQESVLVIEDMQKTFLQEVSAVKKVSDRFSFFDTTISAPGTSTESFQTPSDSTSTANSEQLETSELTT